VKVLEDYEERLLACLAQDEVTDGIERRTPPLERVHRLPHWIVAPGVEQRQQRWEQGLEALVEREDLPGDSLADRAQIVAILNLEIPLEEIGHRQVGRGLAV
jgi:hypothetical protein